MGVRIATLRERKKWVTERCVLPNNSNFLGIECSQEKAVQLLGLVELVETSTGKKESRRILLAMFPRFIYRQHFLNQVATFTCNCALS